MHPAETLPFRRTDRARNPALTLPRPGRVTADPASFGQGSGQGRPATMQGRVRVQAGYIAGQSSLPEVYRTAGRGLPGGLRRSAIRRHKLDRLVDLGRPQPPDGQADMCRFAPGQLPGQGVDATRVTSGCKIITSARPSTHFAPSCSPARRWIPSGFYPPSEINYPPRKTGHSGRYPGRRGCYTRRPPKIELDQFPGSLCPDIGTAREVLGTARPQVRAAQATAQEVLGICSEQ